MVFHLLVQSIVIHRQSRWITIDLEKRGIKDITEITEKQIPDFFDDVKKGIVKTQKGKTIDKAPESLEGERQCFEFFKRYDLIDTGRFWLNRNLQWCLVDDGEVIVID